MFMLVCVHTESLLFLLFTEILTAVYLVVRMIAR